MRKAFYAVRTIRFPDGKKTNISMHRMILPDTIQVDHRDGDGLNNRRANLRPCTATQNKQNTTGRSHNKSGYIGVYWSAGHKRWRAQVIAFGILRYTGTFRDVVQAAKARDAAAKLYHGEFARLNFPAEQA